MATSRRRARRLIVLCISNPNPYPNHPPSLTPSPTPSPTVTSGLIDFCIMLRRLRQIRLRHMVTPHTVTSVTPPVTPNSVTQQGYHHPMRVMVTSRHSLVTPPRHSPLHSPTSLFASLLASLPRHSTASLPATPSRPPRVTPSRHSPRHSSHHSMT